MDKTQILYVDNYVKYSSNYSAQSDLKAFTFTICQFQTIFDDWSFTHPVSFLSGALLLTAYRELLHHNSQEEIIQWLTIIDTIKLSKLSIFELLAMYLFGLYSVEWWGILWSNTIDCCGNQSTSGINAFLLNSFILCFYLNSILFLWPVFSFLGS